MLTGPTRNSDQTVRKSPVRRGFFLLVQQGERRKLGRADRKHQLAQFSPGLAHAPRVDAKHAGAQRAVTIVFLVCFTIQPLLSVSASLLHLISPEGTAHTNATALD